MSKLSPALKALIAAPFAKPGPAPASKAIQDVYRKIASEAASHKVGQPAWVTLCASATVTRNSPAALSHLYDFAASNDSSTSFSPSSSSNTPSPHAISTAELIREVGLKAICFNGVPRTINMLNAFYASLPSDLKPHLRTAPIRTINPTNTSSIAAAGQKLWDSVYLGFSEKLYSKLADSHPDLPVHILFNEYGALLADSERREELPGRIGRVLTSVAAVTCLRAQTGVGPQVTSHVFGLRKAWDDGSWRGDVESEESVRYLASDEGSMWILESTDRICRSLDEGEEEQPRAKL